MHGVRELAARVLDKQVRLGRPMRLQGLAEAVGGPAFASCAGLLLYAARDRLEAVDRGDGADPGSPGRLARIGKWLKQNF